MLLTSQHVVLPLMLERQSPSCTSALRFRFTSNRTNSFHVVFVARQNPPHSARKVPKNLHHFRRSKAPPDLVIDRFPPEKEDNRSRTLDQKQDGLVFLDNKEDDAGYLDDETIWSTEELDAISALFEKKTPPKQANLAKERPLRLPLPHKTKLLQTPAPKHHVRLASRPVLAVRSLTSDKVRKNPEALVGIAREIGALPSDVNARKVLDKWSPFLRKGSLSLIVRELGHMGLDERALQTLCWAQNHRPEFFPDDRILASTVEVLARNGKLKVESEMEKYLHSASRSVVEAIARGFIRAGHLRRARKLLLLAKHNNRTLDPSIHAKLILASGKTPEGYKLALALLEELGEREDFDLKPQDCTAIMKVCIKLQRFEVVESLFNWFKESGRSPTIFMYTTVLHSRYQSKHYREGMTLIWEMEALNCLFDLPAYRVVIRTCVALNDLMRALRYFSKLKEAGFVPTYDIYRDIIKAYAASERFAKCRQISKEIEMAGMKLDKETASLLSDSGTGSMS